MKFNFMPTNKVLLGHSKPVYDCSHPATAEFSSCNRIRGPQSLKYLPSGPVVSRKNALLRMSMSQSSKMG